IVPPTPPCNFDITSDVEPITRVDVADIDNPSDATVNGSPALEDFTSIVGHMSAGESYEIALEGNTAGNFTTYFTVFIDWNQNGDWTDAGEMYEIGSITNSTGTDGQQALGSIDVPADAAEGTTLMRVIKNFNVSPTNPCGSYSFGQGEDYTIEVGDENPPTGEDCEQGDDSNAFENGFQIGIGTDFENADDFLVSAGNTLNVQSIELNVLALEPIQSIDFFFREDNAGAPSSTIAQTVSGLIPYDQVLVGSAFGYNVYSVFVEVDLDFEGGTSGATYWMQPQATAAGGATGGVFWEVSSIGTLGNPIHTSEVGGPWTPDVDNSDGVFKLHCDVVEPPQP